MTTTVRVQARAWPATVLVRISTEGEEGHNVEERTITVDAHREFTVHTPGPGKKLTLEVTETAPEEQPAEAEEQPVETTSTDDLPVAEDRGSKSRRSMTAVTDGATD